MGLTPALAAEAKALRGLRRRLAPLTARARATYNNTHATQTATAATRLVTLRFELGQNKEVARSELLWLANMAGARCPEVLVYPGGCRVVYSEELPPTTLLANHQADPAAAPISAEDLQALSEALEELHTRCRRFFVSLIEYHIGWQPQVAVEWQHDSTGQVPPALPSWPHDPSPPRSPDGGAVGSAAHALESRGVLASQAHTAQLQAVPTSTVLPAQHARFAAAAAADHRANVEAREAELLESNRVMRARLAAARGEELQA